MDERQRRPEDLDILEPDARIVYVVNIDIKDGWYDVMSAWSTREAADREVERLSQATGDHVYVAHAELDPPR